MLADRRTSMGIRASALRSLDKPQAMLAAIDLIATSSHAARSLTGYLDHAERRGRTGVRRGASARPSP